MLKKLLHRHNSHPVLRQELTFGQRAADQLTRFAGSWYFIVILGIFIFIWILLNTVAWINNWDPWPFIILNLTLSCLAAVQAPIILMSQNRQAERDRINAKYDYRVNRKAEQEVRDMQNDLEEIKDLIRKKKK